MGERERYVKTLPDGSEEGVHPDELESSDFFHTTAGFSAIRAKCLDCAVHESEVRKCVCYTCPLWPFRLGRNPKALKIKRGYALGKT
jgi:hypothetical protein